MLTPSKNTLRGLRSPKLILKSSLLLSVGFSTLAMSSAAIAQNAAEDEVIVTGTRQTIQDSIKLKREATTIVDGLSASEIGDIPALSIGEALETLTGASSHRENGGATEISIRGLGPFLSSTVFNGREATNGSGDRSVNFSQFPSELMSKIAIYKTQDASLIEGGVAGQIHLETLKPLDFGKERLQFSVKGNINPDQKNIEDSMEGDLGYRLTGSYVNAFDYSDGSELGISIGGQISAISQPEQEIRSSSPTGSSLWACLYNPQGEFNGNQGFNSDAPSDDDCEDDNTSRGDRPDTYRGTNDGYDTRINPDTGLAYDDGEQYAYGMSSRGYRQNDTSDQRDSLFGALQFRPTPSWEINLDAQWSKRTQEEDRYDFYFNNSRRNQDNLNGFQGHDSTESSIVFVDGNSGSVEQIAYDTEITTGGETFNRTEEYTGFGAGVSHNVSEKLTAAVDFSYSETTRTEIQQTLQVQTGTSTNSTTGRFPIEYSIASGIPQYIIGPNSNGVFDPLDASMFVDDIRVRVDSDVDRKNTVTAGKLDFNYEANFFDVVDSIDFGGRYADQNYRNLGGQRDTYTKSDNDDGIYDCVTPFAESGFLSSVRDGALITTVDGDGNTVDSYNSWITFDNNCLSSYIRDGADLVYPDQIYESGATTDVTEKTLAAYIKANYSGEMGSTPIRGNIGVRIVDTKVDSIGFRPDYDIVTNADGGLELIEGDELERVSAGGSYTEILPSFNFVADLSDDIVFRGGIFRGLSRIDPSDMSNSRTFEGVQPEDGEIITDLEDLLVVRGSGNPFAKPLPSWNFDAGMEWYKNEDTLFAVAAYYKKFTGGFENAVQLEDFVVDGLSVTLPVTVQATNDETSNLYGLEFTGTHRFHYLPGALSGLGAKLSWNIADSDFEFHDSNYGDRGVRELDGSFTQTHIGLIAPANVPGFSKNVVSAQLYWNYDDFDISAYYKYRSDYLQPYTSNGTRIRYVDDNSVVELRASYRVNDNFKVKVEALNLFDEPRRDFFYEGNHFGQSSIYGPRIFFGLSGKF